MLRLRSARAVEPYASGRGGNRVKAILGIHQGAEFLARRGHVPLLVLDDPVAGRTCRRQHRRLRWLPGDGIMGKNMPLELVSLDRQFDAEIFGWHQGLEAARDGSEQLVAIQVPTDGAIDVNQCAQLHIESLDILVGMEPLDLGSGERSQNLQEGDLVRLWMQRLVVHHGQMPQDVARGIA